MVVSYEESYMASFADEFQNVRRLPTRRFSLRITHVGIGHRMAAMREQSRIQTVKDADGASFRDILVGPSLLCEISSVA